MRTNEIPHPTPSTSSGTSVSEPSAPGAGEVAIYEWNTGEKFMAQLVFPGATRIAATIDDSAEEILARIPPDCRLFIFQVNLSLSGRFPLARAELVTGLESRGVRILNRGLVDSSKTALHRMLREAGLPCAASTEKCSPEDLMIVKTDFNYAGLYERQLSEPDRLRLQIPPWSDTIDDWSDYRFLQHREIPPEWRTDGSLVIERFVDNPAGEFFRICVSGESLIVVRAYSDAMIKKVSAGPRDENFLTCRSRLTRLDDNGFLRPELLHALDRFLNVTKLDFGTLDVVHDAREFFIVDINLTPYGAWNGLAPEIAEHLRQGFDPP